MLNFYDINLYIFLILGLLIGSFLNVVIYRAPREMTFCKGRSMCLNCKHQLMWYDLIPLFSYLFLRGKCRYCKEKISIQYPLVESITGIVFALIYSYITYHTGESLKYYHILLFIIAAFAIIGIFTDFLYHGTFDISTTYICGLFFIYLVIVNKSFVEPLKLLLQSIIYFTPIFFIVLYLNFKLKGKYILAILSLVTFSVITLFGLLNFSFDIYTASLIGNSVVNWICLFLLLILTDYILKKVVKSEKIKDGITHIVNYLSFILYFIFLFNLNSEMFSINSIKETLTLSGKNIIIIFVFTMFYMFFIDIFNGHDNSEEILDSDDEVIDRSENIFSSFIGDGDLFTIPFMGMLLGYANVFNFYAIMGFTVLFIYPVIFRKGLQYTIPLYPFILLSIFVLL